MQENINIPDSEITTNLSFRQLVLMNMKQLTNFPYIEKDFDALTDYELLCLVVKFLNDVIANQNEQNASITRMYQSFLALQDYVNNTKDELETAFNNLDNYVRYYFDNLDVQKEINNKLDKMLEDGVLEEIIDQFIQTNALWCFNTVAEMKAATNLINNSKAYTLGYYSLNDGGAASYTIATTVKTNDLYEELNNGLYAKLVIENDSLNLLQVGAKKDESADVGAIINSVIEKGYTNIFIPKGNYLVNTSINLNDCVGINIVGEMSGTYKSAINATKLIGNTGSNAIIKMIGSNQICLEKLCLLSTDDTENPSTLGILQGCSSTNQFSQWINLTNVYINLISSDTANSNNGSIGIYNWQSELNSYLNVFSYADIPVYLTRDDELEVAQNNGAILPSHDSLTGNNYTKLETQSKKEYTICIGGDSLTFTGFYGQGTVKFLTNVRGDYQTNNIFIQGIVEKNSENTISSTFEITPRARLQRSFINVTSVGHAVAFYCTTAGQVISNSYINISGNLSSGNLADTKIQFVNNIIYKGSSLINNAYSQGNIIIGGNVSKATANSNLSLLTDGIIYSNGVGFGFSNAKPTRTDLPNNSTIINTGNTIFVGWRYKSSSNSWIPIGIGTPLETDAGSINSQTPLYVGQLLHNVSDDSMWMSYATTQGAWKQITN